jgi:hypothetical protein
MTKRSIRQVLVVACLALAAGFLTAPSAAADAPRVARPVGLRVGLKDTGKTVALPVGQQLIVALPLRPYPDNSWRLVSNSGAGVKLIAGPDERRPPNWTPMKDSTQLFYFQRESPGTANLVLEQRYWSKPMFLKVVDP